MMDIQRSAEPEGEPRQAAIRKQTAFSNEGAARWVPVLLRSNHEEIVVFAALDLDFPRMPKAP